MRGYLFAGLGSWPELKNASSSDLDSQFRCTDNRIRSWTGLRPELNIRSGLCFWEILATTHRARNNPPTGVVDYQSGLPSTETGDGSSERPVLISTAKGRGSPEFVGS